MILLLNFDINWFFRTCTLLTNDYNNNRYHSRTIQRMLWLWYDIAFNYHKNIQDNYNKAHHKKFSAKIKKQQYNYKFHTPNDPLQ